MDENGNKLENTFMDVWLIYTSNLSDLREPNKAEKVLWWNIGTVWVKGIYVVYSPESICNQISWSFSISEVGECSIEALGHLDYSTMTHYCSFGSWILSKCCGDSDQCAMCSKQETRSPPFPGRSTTTLKVAGVYTRLSILQGWEQRLQLTGTYPTRARIA